MIFCTLLQKLIEILCGISISFEARIGKGLYIGHFGNIFIHKWTVIGENCNISQGVSIGLGGRGEEIGAPIVGDRVYIGSDDRQLYCLEAATGRPVWVRLVPDGIWSSPCVVDGKVVFGSFDGRLRMLSAADGRSLWSYRTRGAIVSTACIVDGWIWIGSRDGHVYCFAPRA